MDTSETPLEDNPENAPEEIAPSLSALREEIAAATAENRRTAKRTIDFLKQFGSAMDALSGTVNDLTRCLKPQQANPGIPKNHLLGLIELADRVQRLAAAFERRPATTSSWLPATKKTLATWDAAWNTQSQALAIFRLHLDGLLKNAGLERIHVLQQPFDPARMTAVESVQDNSLPDHTVLEEVLPGWQKSDSAEILRLAHVRVSRR